MSDVLFGYITALTPINLIAAVISVAIGITIGALPGLSAAMGVALLIPITFGIDPSTGLITFAGDIWWFDFSYLNPYTRYSSCGCNCYRWL